MSYPYTTMEIDGHTCWFNAQGDQVAHYPDMLLHALLTRTVEQAQGEGIITEETAARLDQLMLAAWPMQSTESAEEFNARCALVEEFRQAGLLA